MKIYLAGALFSMAERNFNVGLAGALEKRLIESEVMLPQEREKKLLKLDDARAKIFSDCISAVDEADVVLALLEGPDVDSGTSVEMGYAFAQGKPIVGLRTDFRISEDGGLNLMVSNVCDALIVDKGLGLDDLADKCAEAIRRLTMPVC